MPAPGICEETHPSVSLGPRAVLSMLVGDDSAAFLGFTPKIKQIQNIEPNAFAVSSQSQIVISAGLLRLIRDPNELAFVVAHELGHLALHGHPGKASLLGQENQQSEAQREIDADMYAVALLNSAGFDSRAGAAFIRRIMNTPSPRNWVLGDIYPTLKIRLENLRRTR